MKKVPYKMRVRNKDVEFSILEQEPTSSNKYKATIIGKTALRYLKPRAFKNQYK